MAVRDTDPGRGRELADQEAPPLLTRAFRPEDLLHTPDEAILQAAGLTPEAPGEPPLVTAKRTLARLRRARRSGGRARRAAPPTT